MLVDILQLMIKIFLKKFLQFFVLLNSTQRTIHLLQCFIIRYLCYCHHTCSWKNCVLISVHHLLESFQVCWLWTKFLRFIFCQTNQLFVTIPMSCYHAIVLYDTVYHINGSESTTNKVNKRMKICISEKLLPNSTFPVDHTMKLQHYVFNISH